jgi:hypothetical protein
MTANHLLTGIAPISNMSYISNISVNGQVSNIILVLLNVITSDETLIYDHGSGTKQLSQ